MGCPQIRETWTIIQKLVCFFQDSSQRLWIPWMKWSSLPSFCFFWSIIWTSLESVESDLSWCQPVPVSCRTPQPKSLSASPFLPALILHNLRPTHLQFCFQRTNTERSQDTAGFSRRALMHKTHKGQIWCLQDLKYAQMFPHPNHPWRGGRRRENEDARVLQSETAPPQIAQVLAVCSRGRSLADASSSSCSAETTSQDAILSRVPERIKK